MTFMYRDILSSFFCCCCCWLGADSSVNRRREIAQFSEKRPSIGTVVQRAKYAAVTGLARVHVLRRYVGVRTRDQVLFMCAALIGGLQARTQNYDAFD